jgi:hypothetical protein
MRVLRDMSATAEPSLIASSTLFTTVETGTSAGRRYDHISWVTLQKSIPWMVLAVAEAEEGTPMKLKADKASKQRSWCWRLQRPRRVPP